MSITRRNFIVHVAGGAAAASAAPLLLGVPSAAERTVARIIQERFPYVSASHPALREFATAFVARDPHAPGLLNITRAEAADPNNSVVEYERYVAREFAFSSNVLDYGAGRADRLEYAPAPVLDHSAARFVRSPAARALRLTRV
jgi:hypothetical protein